MKNYLPAILLFFIFLASCSPRLGESFIEPEDLYIEFSDSTFNLEMLYLGAGQNFLAFEAEFVNHSDEKKELKQSDFSLKDLGYGDEFQPYSTDELMEILILDRKRAEKESRRRALYAVFGFASNIILGAVGNISIGDVIYYSMQDAVYLSLDKRDIRRNINSIEEEMEYIREINLDSVLVVQPMDTVIREIFFPFEYSRSSFELSYRPTDSLNFSISLSPEDLHLN